MLEKQSASANKITRDMVTGIVMIMGTKVDISLGNTRINPSSHLGNFHNEMLEMKHIRTSNQIIA